MVTRALAHACADAVSTTYLLLKFRPATDVCLNYFYSCSNGIVDYLDTWTNISYNRSFQRHAFGPSASFHTFNASRHRHRVRSSHGSYRRGESQNCEHFVSNILVNFSLVFVNLLIMIEVLLFLLSYCLLF